VAEPDIRRGLVANILDKDKLPVMLHDNFANYVVQTSLDVSDPDQHFMVTLFLYSIPCSKVRIKRWLTLSRPFHLLTVGGACETHPSCDPPPPLL